MRTWPVMMVVAVYTLVAAPALAGPTSGGGGDRVAFEDKILGGYLGWFHPPEGGDAEKVIKLLIDPMAEAGFNAVGISLNAKPITGQDRASWRGEFKKLVRAADQRGLTVMVYITASDKNREPDQHADLPAFVAPDGRVFEGRFSIIDFPVWRAVFKEAFVLARMSNRLPIAAVKLDLERFYGNNAIHDAMSYDDKAWKRFAGSRKDVPADVEAKRRGAWLDEHEMNDAYGRWWNKQLVKVAKRYERQMHEINPDLMLGVMPAGHGVKPGKKRGLYAAFVKHLGTERAPGIMDTWEYGLGYDEKFKKMMKNLNEANPHNRVVPWLSPRRNYPENLYNRGYFYAMSSEGYSNWNMKMVTKKLGSNKWDIPKDFDAADYFAAYEKLNTLIARDLSRGITKPVSIEMKPLKGEQEEKDQTSGRTAPPLDLDHDVPALVPAGDGKDKAEMLMLSGQNVIYFHAESGQTVKVDMKLHRKAWPTGFAVIDRDNKVLTQGKLTSTERRTITVKPEHKGTYALLIHSREAGGPSYKVTVHADHTGVLVEDEAHFYGPPSQPTYWVTRSRMTGEAKLKFKTGRGQMYQVSLNGGDPVDVLSSEPAVIELPEGRRVHSIEVIKPENLKSYGLWAGNMYISSSGNLVPLFSDGKQRRLVPAE